MTVLRALARLSPWEVEPSADLRRAVRFLDWSVRSGVLVQAGYCVGIVVGSLLLGAAFLLPGAYRTAGVLVALACGLGVTHAVHATPKFLARVRRTRTLGAAPDLVARAVLRMRLGPAAERAAAFTAASGESPLARSLARHVRAERTTSGSGFRSFGEEWGEWFPSLDRALELVDVAGTVSGEDRERVLDRALSTVLDGMRTRMREYASTIRGPTTALYAFGVLLPTALVALLPAARASGIAVTPLTVVLVYDVAVPLVLAAGSAWLLARRPVVFPPPSVRLSHPDVPDRSTLALLTAVGVGTVAWLVAGALAPGWAPPIAAVGCGTGTGLWLRYQPVCAVHERVRAVERGLTDALTLVGRRVAAGESVESALASAAEDIDGPMGDVLAAGDRRQRRLQASVREAFLGEQGALATLPSKRLRGSLALVALSAKEGRPAGNAILELADHVEELQHVENEARADLEQVCGTLRSTGSLFGPLVAGATVALAEGMTGSGFLGGGALPWLGGAVGVYVLLLAALLTALATGLTHGFDRGLVGHRVGRALAVATSVYVGSYLLVGGVA